MDKHVSAHVIHVLEKNRNGLTVNEIVSKTKLEKQQIYNALSHLRISGRIEKTRDNGVEKHKIIGSIFPKYYFISAAKRFTTASTFSELLKKKKEFEHTNENFAIYIRIDDGN